MNSPIMPAIKAMDTENICYCFIVFEMFRAAAPGSTKSEFIIIRPTQEMESVTITAMATVNAVWFAWV